MTTDPLDAARQFAEMAATISFAILPDAAIEIAKKNLPDTLGVALAARPTSQVGQLARLYESWAGTAESTLLSSGRRVPAPHAAFINGAMAHSLDYDDALDHGPAHVGAVIIPAVLAIAERQGGCDGKSLVTAIMLGEELMCRMAIAAPHPMQGGWHPTGVYGYFGAALAAARILRTDADRIVHALGLAHSQSAGNVQGFVDGESADTKRLQAGFAAQGGVVSALLAQAGLTGPERPIEGRFGHLNLYHRGDYRRDVLLDGLGSRFEMASLSFKMSPCVRGSQRFIDAAVQLASPS